MGLQVFFQLQVEPPGRCRPVVQPDKGRCWRRRIPPRRLCAPSLHVPPNVSDPGGRERSGLRGPGASRGVPAFQSQRKSGRPLPGDPRPAAVVRPTPHRFFAFLKRDAECGGTVEKKKPTRVYAPRRAMQITSRKKKPAGRAASPKRAAQPRPGPGNREHYQAPGPSIRHQPLANDGPQFAPFTARRSARPISAKLSNNSSANVVDRVLPTEKRSFSFGRPAP